MKDPIENALDEYDSGSISRRQLLRSLVGVLATAGGMKALGEDEGTSEPTFQSVGLDHIALRVSDVARSRDFYVKHLGLTVSSDSGGSAFLNCGDDFVALFRGERPGLDHYCFAISDYDVSDAEQRLRDAGLPNIRRTSGRIYFDDPDGIVVQLAGD